MIAVITADIINSTSNYNWRKNVEQYLNQIPSIEWSIYRGDSIQIRIENPENVLNVALGLKSSVRQLPKLDIRIAIGLGEESLRTDSVTQNQGGAYINSGRLFEELSQNLAIKTNEENIDIGLNAGLNLFNIICEQWTVKMAQYVHAKLMNPDANQEELAKILNTSQSNVSRVLARSNYQVLLQYMQFFQQFIQSRL